ncbi:M48 family metallopeptidase [Romboutsia sp. Marseille-P6047]|uniref:M48 family metallopeptidase n=1 Tax=Romboutsia sp. Marseille-P6047 TaxID=2161817 RepID=UPI000F04EFD6|nr:SprT family zinc-dependent metalloprotease [Romboutsia sp. Marseille-P6047]
MSKDKLLHNKNTISIKYKGIDINVNLIYRKRKNITIQIKPNYEVSIISPLGVPKKLLKNFLIEKSDWILKKFDEYKEVEHIYKEKEFVDNEKYMYLGKEYNLKIIIDENEEVFIDNDLLIVRVKNTEKEYIKNKLKLWYKKESERIVIERLVYCREHCSMMMRLIPSKLKVKEQKKRGGTCTSKRSIYINSKISMARKEAIDYILIHEFSHLVHMNHSKDFYSLVKQMMPNYKEQEKWLKENSYKLKL